jgi:methionine-rich copper-binding protein CopC
MTTSTTRARHLALTAVAALLLLFPATVAAHAELLEAVPAPGATVVGTPDELSATFSEPLLVDGTTFSIRNAAGERLAVGRIDPADDTRLIIDPVPDLAPGVYEMRWQAATADGHIENDTWTFTVEAPTPPSPTPTAAATPSDSAAPSASAQATPEPSAEVSPTPSGSAAPQDPAASSADVVLPIIIGLAVVLIAAGYLVSRRGRPPGRA